jgi:methylmalonyl-CoA/ethylmalonyl-CoA epimerase
MRKIEHIGIAVDNLDEANALYHAMLGVSHYKIEEVISEAVRTSFFQVGESKIELLEATSEDSPIAKFITKKGPGVHHIAFDVKDIQASMQRMRDAGFVLINEEPKRGADNKLVCFVHPKSSGGVLIELCQEIPPSTDVTSSQGDLSSTNVTSAPDEPSSQGDLSSTDATSSTDEPSSADVKDSG